MENIQSLKMDLLKSVEGATNLNELEEARIQALGKKGKLTEVMKTLGALTPDERKEMGQHLNLIKDEVSTALDARKLSLEEASLNERLKSEVIDVTLPGRIQNEGRIHPLSHSLDQAIHIFGQMGFTVAEGPDIENDFNNFSALNIPAEHPARQEQDTFYMPNPEGEMPHVLRTHTSPVQVRTMTSQQPPIRIIAPGRTYRSDYDQTHTPMFHQIEGLVIDKEVNMSHLKGCLEEFCRLFFDDPQLKLRFRPAHFPFTEPSAEVDLLWHNKGKDQWLEILGCGMVHPNVLRNCGVDPEVYQGFAFGMGIERITMLKYGIKDLRLFYESDLRWLRHYGFQWFERG